MKSRWYLVFTIFFFSLASMVAAQTTKKTTTGLVQTSSDEYNRQLEKCKVDAQVAPTPNSTPTKTTSGAGSQKAKSE
jgi:hypothetical protein